MMQRNMKKITCMILTFVMAMCIMPVQTFADSSTTISFEEYSGILINEYAKYGVTVEMESLPNTSYSSELLQEELNKVKNNAEKIKKGQNAPIVVSSETAETGISANAMYYDKTFTNSISKGAAPFIYIVKVTAKLQLDAQRDYIVKGYKPTLKMTSAIGYADYISYKSHTVKIDNSPTKSTKRTATYTIKAELKEELSVEGVTAWTKHTDTLKLTIRPFK